MLQVLRLEFQKFRIFVISNFHPCAMRSTCFPLCKYMYTAYFNGWFYYMNLRFPINPVVQFHHGFIVRDQARGRLGRNSRPRGRNFALNGTQGEVGVSLKKKNFFFFFFLGRLIFILSPHKCKMQAVVTLSDIYYHCIVFLLPLNGNSMCNG